jgi:hypothetical protein
LPGCAAGRFGIAVDAEAVAVAIAVAVVATWEGNAGS